MANVKQQLKQQVFIIYRSSQLISPANASLKFDEQKNALLVVFLNNESEKPVTIEMKDIENVKARDYTVENNYHWVLSIQQREEPRQASLQFRMKEERDTWHNGLRSLLTQQHEGVPVRREEGPAAEPAPQQKRITEVTLHEPGPAVLATVQISLKDKKASQVMLHVPEARASVDDIKRITQDFVRENQVDPVESTSLYRFLRTVVQRALVEQETIAIVEEIKHKNLDVLVREADQKGSREGNVDDLKERAKEELLALKDQIQLRLGDQGTGATIVSLILRQNIEKMLHINELTAKAYIAESEVVSKATRDGW